ncbi:MAG: LysM peptidoglycan-binding domain-containing protein, partial [Acidobacteria bacterium]|nr:LysM peptidoglycan-binding domain-containing protein [Acidobacteriota bacterium]NIQ86490.1 LysM peptidoglycan-binding domain-containing protein [Acidobacteriota bacterium]
KTYGVGLDEIIEVNSILDPSRIAVGDMLWIPGVPDTLDVAIHVPERRAAAGEWIWPLRNGT